jgi:DNA-binding GntR family transcriptional regulator
MHYPTQTLVDVAYKALKKDIAEGILVPGQKLITRELNERYRISETPIKQALNRLITEGLIESTPRRGVKVRAIEWDEIEELWDIRLMFETHYASRIIANFDTAAAEKLAANIAEHTRIIETAVDLNDYFRNYYLDQEFHQLYIKCAGNKKMARIYNNLGTHVYSYYIYGRQSKEETIAGVNEHEAIYAALIAGDEAALRRCVEIHIINAKNKITRILRKG